MLITEDHLPPLTPKEQNVVRKAETYCEQLQQHIVELEEEKK